MINALIGFTGFVGSNIGSQHTFNDLYNSQNISEIEGKKYDVVVSAANKAEMWRINQEPEKDRAEIDEFIAHIEKVEIGKLVLISTVGVYKDPNGANEDTEIDTEGLVPYGANRYYLEQFCRDTFDTTIVRLPGLFGKGIKKNVIYDLLNNNNIDRIHKDGVYQYYNLENIWHDIELAVSNEIPILNLATPPVSTEEVSREAFGIEFTNTPEGITPAFFDMQTKYASIFGCTGNYICTKEAEMADIKKFVESQRTGK